MANSGKPELAVDAYHKALELSPNFVRARTNLGIAFAGAGRLPEAAAELRQAVRLAPGRPDYHYNLGVVLLRQGDPSGAKAAFGRALELRPDYDEAREQWSRLPEGPPPH